MSDDAAALNGGATAAILAQGDPLLTNVDLVPTPIGDRKWTWWHGRVPGLV